MSRTALAALAATLAVTLAACGGSDSSNVTGGGGALPPGGGTTPPVTTPGTVRVASVAVSPTTGSVLVGRTMQLGATPKDSVGNALANRAVTWASSADTILRVDASGVATGVRPGTATITAESEGRSAQATILVQQVPVTTVVVAPDTMTLPVGRTATLAATTRDDQGAVLAGRAVRWTTSAPAVATVDSISGVVRAAGGGTATITASSEGKSGTARVTVVAPVVPVASVAVGTALDTLEAHDVVQLQATLRDAQSNVLAGRTVRWSSSDPKVATVDSVTGQLTGLDRGTVVVTATSEGKSGTASRVVVIKYRSVSAGTEHACDIASGGIVWCWGTNGTQARIGLAQLGADVYSSVPVRIAGTLRFAQLSTFGTTTCGITREGQAYCWGYNGWGNLGNGTSAGQSATPVAVAGGLTFRSISLGAQHSCGVTTDGRTYCWGLNQSSEFGNGNSASSNVPVLAASGMTLATVSGGNDFSCGVTPAGAGWCWGYNGAGNLGDGLRISGGNTYTRTPSAVVGGIGFRSIHASQSYACGLATNGEGWCWGSGGNRFGSGFSAETSTPRAIPGYTWKQLSPGSRQACGITSTDDVYCWGSNVYGQLGNPIGVNGSTTPVRAGGTLKASEVSAANIATGSAAYTCAISADRLTTWCWGKNDRGQLGNGGTSAPDAPNPTPTIVVGQKPLPVTTARR